MSAILDRSGRGEDIFDISIIDYESNYYYPIFQEGKSFCYLSDSGSRILEGDETLELVTAKSITLNLDFDFPGYQLTTTHGGGTTSDRVLTLNLLINEASTQSDIVSGMIDDTIENVFFFKEGLEEDNDLKDCIKGMIAELSFIPFVFAPAHREKLTTPFGFIEVSFILSQ